MSDGGQTATHQAILTRGRLFRSFVIDLFESLLAQVAAVISPFVIRAQCDTAQREDHQHLSHPASVKAPKPCFFSGTLGGNIVNASPAADSPPALLAYDAELELISKSGSRRIAYSRFHRGYKQMELRADELLSAIHLPRSHTARIHYYRKVGTRKAQAISKVCFAGVAEVANRSLTHVRIALGSVAPIPIRCEQTEAAVHGQPLNDETVQIGLSTLAQEIAPIDDIRSTRNYRLQVSLNLLEDFLLRAVRTPSGSDGIKSKT